MRCILVATGILCSASIGLTCCMAYPLSSPMSLVSEKAIIVWDPDRQMEHFVRQASFEGEATDFGFIVPAPTEPKVAEAKEEAFVELEEYVASETAKRGSGIGCSRPPETEAATGGVELVDQYLVGDFEVSILRGTDGAAILGWLKANNYSQRPAMEEWLDHYAKMSWYFAALKFVRAEDADTPETKAVRVSFTTDVPFYPYKMPSDTWPKEHFRPIALYFVSNGVARGFYRIGSENWEAREQWSGDLPRGQAMALASNIGLAPDDIPEEAVLTAFLNTQNAQDCDSDLYFLTYRSVLPTWALLGVVVLVVGGIVWLVVSRKRTPATGQ